MEYKIFDKFRNKIKIPIFFRIGMAILCILIWILGTFIPVIPWAIFFIIWALLLIPAHKVKHLVKIRKWLVYMFQNIHERRIVRHKVMDIIIHSKDLVWISNKKETFFEKLLKKIKIK